MNTSQYLTQSPYHWLSHEGDLDLRDRFPFLQSVWENGTDFTVTAPPPAPRAWGGHRGGVPPRVAGHDRAGGAPLGADATDLPLPSSVDQACVTSLALHLPHTGCVPRRLSFRYGRWEPEYIAAPPHTGASRFEKRASAVDLSIIFAFAAGKIVACRVRQVFPGGEQTRHISQIVLSSQATFLLSCFILRWTKSCKHFTK